MLEHHVRILWSVSHESNVYLLNSCGSVHRSRLCRRYSGLRSTRSLQELLRAAIHGTRVARVDVSLAQLVHGVARTSEPVAFFFLIRFILRGGFILISIHFIQRQLER